jgi:hypothetical protein
MSRTRAIQAVFKNVLLPQDFSGGFILQLIQLDMFSEPMAFAPPAAPEPVAEAPCFALALVPQVDYEAASPAEPATDAWLEDLWTAAGNGFADKEEWREDQLSYFFTIQETDADSYPGLQAGSRVKLWEDADGQRCFKVFKSPQELQSQSQ